MLMNLIMTKSCMHMRQYGLLHGGARNLLIVCIQNHPVYLFNSYNCFFKHRQVEWFTYKSFAIPIMHRCLMFA